jgi:hypothetical protein
MAPLVPSGTEVLAGLEMGGIPVVTALGRHTGLPCAFMRKQAKPYGTCRLAEGAEIEDGCRSSEGAYKTGVTCAVTHPSVLWGASRRRRPCWSARLVTTARMFRCRNDRTRTLPDQPPTTNLLVTHRRMGVW